MRNESITVGGVVAAQAVRLGSRAWNQAAQYLRYASTAAAAADFRNKHTI
jgi:hypothetical protein